MNCRAAFKPLTGALCAALVLCAIQGIAHAVQAVGRVKGTVNLWNKNGNYCPQTNQCVGSVYTQLDYDTWKPLANAFVNVYDGAGNFIGQGGTDDAGKYDVQWTAPTRPAQYSLRFYAWHKGNRFYFTDTAGSAYYKYTVLLTLPTNADPPSQGWYLGSSTSADSYLNAYWAAELMWRRVMNLVGVLQTNFMFVEIRGFADTLPGFIDDVPHTTSIASGPKKRVHLDANAAFTPQMRVMHEMGHVADYLTHPWKVTADYKWGGGAVAWQVNSPEFGMDAFQEGIATHYANLALWGDNAVTPTTCTSSSHCYATNGTPNTATNIETTSFAHDTNNCSLTTSNPESRWPLTSMRYLWDIFDNHNDADGDDYSANQLHFWRHLANTYYYPEGYDIYQINEPWSTGLAGTILTEKDGRGSTSYLQNYATVKNTTTLWISNCAPF